MVFKKVEKTRTEGQRALNKQETSEKGAINIPRQMKMKFGEINLLYE